MTITSIQTILPKRFTSDATNRKAAKSSPQVYNAKDHPFKGYYPPQPEGYEQSKADPESSAIVIDNGEAYYVIARWVLYLFP